MVSIPEFTNSHIPGALDWNFPPRILLPPTDNGEHAELEARADRIVAQYKLPPAFGINFIGATRRFVTLYFHCYYATLTRSTGSGGSCRCSLLAPNLRLLTCSRPGRMGITRTNMQ